MVEGKGYGNFAFMYDINKDIYECLSYVEKNARLQINKSFLNSARQALEIFIDDVIYDNHLENFISPDKTLWEKIRTLNSTEQMRAAGYLKPYETFGQKPLLPFSRRDFEVEYDIFDKNDPTATAKDSYYYFLRNMGNVGSHPEEFEGDPRLTFDNIEKCLRIMHKIMSRYYGAFTTPAFNPDMMPIGDFIIDKAREPEDSQRSKCKMEFDAHTVNAEGEPEFYALLRMYERTDLDSNFIQRNQDCFVEATKVSLSSVPDGMARLRALTPRKANSRFYIIRYIFNREAKPLRNSVLKKMNMEQRLQMCARLVKCLDNLHNSETPIFHRLLNHECVYVSEFRGNWVPYIVKFDYAKIVMDAKETVYTHAAEASAILRELGRDKYIPPEWKGKDSESADVDWAKVDVYSVGVLIGDILNGKLGGSTIASLDDLEEEGVEESILDILEQMMAQNPINRCSMRQVREVFDREVR